MVVVVGLDWAKEPVLIETELDATSVGNMIILIKIAQKKNQRKCIKCMRWMKNKQH